MSDPFAESPRAIHVYLDRRLRPTFAVRGDPWPPAMVVASAREWARPEGEDLVYLEGMPAGFTAGGIALAARKGMFGLRAASDRIDEIKRKRASDRRAPR